MVACKYTFNVPAEQAGLQILEMVFGDRIIYVADYIYTFGSIQNNQNAGYLIGFVNQTPDDLSSLATVQIISVSSVNNGDGSYTTEIITNYCGESISANLAELNTITSVSVEQVDVPACTQTVVLTGTTIEDISYTHGELSGTIEQTYDLSDWASAAELSGKVTEVTGVSIFFSYIQTGASEYTVTVTYWDSTFSLKTVDDGVGGSPVEISVPECEQVVDCTIFYLFATPNTEQSSNVFNVQAAINTLSPDPMQMQCESPVYEWSVISGTADISSPNTASTTVTVLSESAVVQVVAHCSNLLECEYQRNITLTVITSEDCDPDIGCDNKEFPAEHTLRLITLADDNGCPALAASMFDGDVSPDTTCGYSPSIEEVFRMAVLNGRLSLYDSSDVATGLSCEDLQAVTPASFLVKDENGCPHIAVEEVSGIPVCDDECHTKTLYDVIVKKGNGFAVRIIAVSAMDEYFNCDNSGISTEQLISRMIRKVGNDYALAVKIT